MDFQVKILWKRGIRPTHVPCFTLKFIFWPWRVMKMISEMDCPVKITRKWGITVVPSFICWKSYFTLQLTFHSQKCLARYWLCVLDADAHADAHSDARSDAKKRSHVPQFPRSDNHDKVPQSVCQSSIFSWTLQFMKYVFCSRRIVDRSRL